MFGKKNKNKNNFELRNCFRDILERVSLRDEVRENRINTRGIADFPERVEQKIALNSRKEVQIGSFVMQNKKGQLLVEVLIVISVAAVIGALGAQFIYVGLVSNKRAGEKNVALGLGEETFEAVRAASTENWLSLFNSTKGSTNYYPSSTSTPGKWTLAAGSDNVAIDEATYIRSFTVQNVCRDNTTRGITGISDSGGSAMTCTTSGGSHDPSTQKVNVSVVVSGADSVTQSEYIARWRNEACAQTSWSGGVGSGATNCSSTQYDSKSNVTAGTDLQLCVGGC